MVAATFIVCSAGRRTSTAVLRATTARRSRPTAVAIGRRTVHTPPRLAGASTNAASQSRAVAAAAAAAALVASTCLVAAASTECAPLGAEANMLMPTAEPSTGILFPGLCNGMAFVGCGVRVKYAFVKVYAVGTYVDPLAMSAVKSRGSAEIEKALLDPNYPRTIRIVMNRDLSIDKYTAAIIEAIEPRLHGEDLNVLDEFKKLNPPVDLIQGAEMEMTIRGDTMLYKNAVGGVGQIRSLAFTRALCDVYYGSDAVSPGHKNDVLKNIPKLQSF